MNQKIPTSTFFVRSVNSSKIPIARGNMKPYEEIRSLSQQAGVRACIARASANHAMNKAAAAVAYAKELNARRMLLKQRYLNLQDLATSLQSSIHLRF